MAWHLPGGSGILEGAVGDLFRASLASVYDLMLEEADQGMDQWEFGIPAFDGLAWPQRLSLLVEVGEAILYRHVRELTLTAVREAAVGAVTENVYMQLDIEVDESRAFGDEPVVPRYHWRRLVRQTLLADTESLRAAMCIPDEKSEDKDQWQAVIETCFSRVVLWNGDWLEERFHGRKTQAAGALKRRLGIPPGYYSAATPAPKAGDIPLVIGRMNALIASVEEDLRLYIPGFVPDLDFG